MASVILLNKNHMPCKNMSEQEGVIKYKLIHLNHPLDKHISISEINSWRHILFKLGLIGQHPDRYAGYGFGNISQRINHPPFETQQFIISGTQTGAIQTLTKKHYCCVLEANPDLNSIKSSGEIQPSSEALTHASVYQHDNTIQSVIHVHNPDIWNNTQQLKLAHTTADIPYGTPEMANKVRYLLQSKNIKNTGIFSMLGHEDGIIAFSDSIQKAAHLLIDYYAKAMTLKSIT